MPVSKVLQVGREQMMHQNIRFNFLFNLEDYGKKSWNYWVIEGQIKVKKSIFL